jgi:hypothetical protein
MIVGPGWFVKKYMFVSVVITGKPRPVALFENTGAADWFV